MSNTSTNETTPENQQVQEAEIYSRDQHCISRNNIDSDALKIMYRLIRFGHKAYLVGGGVRDLLLDKKPKDFDIATDATPGQIRSLFRNSRIIGRRFKLAHIYFKNRKIIEVSTFRDVQDPIDLEDDVSKEDLIITRDNKYGTAATDALRRDLTINGLFYDLSTFSIIDFVGGMQDLKSGIIRVIGDPDVRYVEDPVRILRVVRHAARADFQIEQNCFDAILRNHELITLSPSMRTYEELKKDLSSGYSLDIFRLLHKAAILQHLIPDFTVNDGQMLDASHPFSQSLERLDTLLREGKTPSHTAILGVISIFLAASENTAVADLVDSFDNRSHIQEHLSSCFVKLAVPRKERERIEDVLALWFKIHQTAPEKLKASTLERRKCIVDLRDMLDILGGTEPEIESVVAQACADRRKNKNRRGGRGGDKRNKGGRSNSKRTSRRKSSKRSR